MDSTQLDKILRQADEVNTEAEKLIKEYEECKNAKWS